MSLLRWLSDRSAPSRMELEPEECVDVHSFRALERLAVHEARTEADRSSSARRTVKLPQAARRWRPTVVSRRKRA